MVYGCVGMSTRYPSFSNVYKDRELTICNVISSAVKVL